LQPAKFNLQEEQIDETNIRLTIECKILKLAFANICAAIFVELCSGYSSQSHAAIEHIKQTYAGSDGQPVTAQVFEYYQRMLNAVRPFVKERTWPVSVCNRFIGGLDRRIITSFRKHYPDHVTQHNLAGTFQRKQLPQILKGVQLAEDEVHQIQTITRAAVGQGFYCGVTNKNDQPSVSGREYNHQVQGQFQPFPRYFRHIRLPSHATQVLRMRWQPTWPKNGKPNCPHRNDPRCQLQAEKEFTEFKKRLKCHTLTFTMSR